MSTLVQLTIMSVIETFPIFSWIIFKIVLFQKAVILFCLLMLLSSFKISIPILVYLRSLTSKTLFKWRKKVSFHKDKIFLKGQSHKRVDESLKRYFWVHSFYIKQKEDKLLIWAKKGLWKAKTFQPIN